MSADLPSRLRKWAQNIYPADSEYRELAKNAAGRIEWLERKLQEGGDTALLRQALDAMQVAARCDMWPEEERQQDAVIAALRERLGEKT